MTATPLSLVVAAIAAWLVIGALGLVRPRNLRFISRVLFPAGAAVALALAGGGGICDRRHHRQSTVLPLGLPDLPFHLRLDALSAFFLLLLGRRQRGDLAVFRRLFPHQRGDRARRHLSSSTTRFSRRWRSCWSPTTRTCSWWRGRRWRWRRSSSSRPTIASPRSAARDSSTSLIAHVGAIAILLCFGVLQGGSGDYTFGSMRSVTLTGSVAHRRVLSRARGLRRQGRPPAAAHLAAGGAPGSPVAGFGADERRDAEDGDLRPVARGVRPPRMPSSGGGAWSRSRSGFAPRCSASCSRRCSRT